MRNRTEYQKQYYHANKEKMTAYFKVRYQEKKEEILERAKKRIFAHLYKNT